MVLPTAKERVLTAINHQTPDRLPKGELVIEETFLDGFYPRRAKLSYYEKMRYFVEDVGLDLVTVNVEDDAGDKALVEIDRWATETDSFVFGLVDGLFWKPRDPVSFEGFVLGALKREQGIKDLIKTKKNRTLLWIKKCLDHGAHGLIIGDDLAYNQGPFISPTDLKRWIFPGLLEMVELIKGDGAIIFLHSCGNLMDIVDMILSTGFQGLHGLAPSAGNAPLTIREKTFGKMALWGVFEVDHGPEEIETMKENLLRNLAAGGGYILGSAGGLSTNTPTESVRILYGNNP